MATARFLAGTGGDSHKQVWTWLGVGKARGSQYGEGVGLGSPTEQVWSGPDMITSNASVIITPRPTTITPLDHHS